MKLKLFHKLLLALFLATALVLALGFVISWANIGRGFVDFLRQEEQTSLDNLLPELAQLYQTENGWAAIQRDPRQFHDLLYRYLPPPRREDRGGPGGSPGRPGPGQDGLERDRGPGHNGRRPPPPPGARPRRGGRGEPRGLAGRIYLLDQQQNPVVGHPPPDSDSANLTPILLDDRTIGWLGIAPRGGPSSPGERAFARQQGSILLWSLLAGISLAAILAWLLARHLSRPVAAVSSTIRDLAAGDYGSRTMVSGSDEIADLGNHVNQLAQALSAHESARTRWIADIAHELRTPLSILRGELEAIRDGVRQPDDKSLQSVEAEVRHLNHLVDDLHQLMLSDSGALSYRMTAVNLNQLLTAATESFQEKARQRELALKLQLPDENVQTQGDERRLKQLLHNLLENAVRYTDEGGSIVLRLSEAPDGPQLTLSDSKPGVSQEQCQQLFDRFYRVESSRNRGHGGSGLGLAICRNIVEAHAGTISARPSPMGGLEILIKLQH